MMADLLVNQMVDRMIGQASALPVLYSFRRCPYAIRARMALAAAQQKVTLREVVLRDKPAAMLTASAKGTVPVLVLPSGDVLDESLDVMLWALRLHDAGGWLTPPQGTPDEMMSLIADNDGPFKHHLDRFKYTSRYEDADVEEHRSAAGAYLRVLENRLVNHEYLCGGRISLADIAIFPFVRQFAAAAGDWLHRGCFPHLVAWLSGLVASDIFVSVMTKHPQWQAGDADTVFPAVI